MLTLLVILAVAAVLLIAASLATTERDVLVDVPPDRPDLGLPKDRFLPHHVDGLRFGMTLRGYRMSEVDLALDRLRDALAERDRRIAELEAALAAVVEPAVAQAEAELAAEEEVQRRYGGTLGHEEDEPLAMPTVVAAMAISEAMAEASEPEDQPDVDAQPWQEETGAGASDVLHPGADTLVPGVPAAPAEPATAGEPEPEPPPPQPGPVPEPAPQPEPEPRIVPPYEPEPLPAQEPTPETEPAPHFDTGLAPEPAPASPPAPGVPPSPAAAEVEPEPWGSEQPAVPSDELDFPEVSPAEALDEPLPESEEQPRWGGPDRT